MISRSGGGSFSRAMPPSDCGKTPSDHSQRRTAARASEKVTPPLPGHATDPWRWPGGSAAYSSATTVYRPNRHGAARSTVFGHQPRVVCSPRWQRSSWKVVSFDQP